MNIYLSKLPQHTRHDLIFQTQYSESHLRIFEFIFRSRQTQSISFQTKEQGSHLRIFTVKQEFLGRLVLHLLAPLVARNVPEYLRTCNCTSNETIEQKENRCIFGEKTLYNMLPGYQELLLLWQVVFNTGFISFDK